MELRQLRYFTVLAAELSFTRAAHKLHVSQPPLSFQIANLEAELGARLFNRTSRRVVLSEEGKAFLPHALAVLARLEEARSHVHRVAAGLQGRVQVGLAGSHFWGPFPQFIQQFRLQRPAVEVALKEMTPSDHLEALRDGRLDLCVSRNPLDAAIKNKINDAGGDSVGDSVRDAGSNSVNDLGSNVEISAALLWRDPVVIALPSGHRLAGRSGLRLVDLKDEDFVSLRVGSSPFAARVFEACVQAGFAPRITQQVVELTAALNLVAAGLGVALVPASLAQQRNDALCICSLSAAQDKKKFKLDGDVYALWRTDDAAPAVTEFRKQLVDWAQALTV